MHFKVGQRDVFQINTYVITVVIKGAICCLIINRLRSQGLFPHANFSFVLIRLKYKFLL
jgi:hypothetical protein